MFRSTIYVERISPAQISLTGSAVENGLVTEFNVNKIYYINKYNTLEYSIIHHQNLYATFHSISSSLDQAPENQGIPLNYTDGISNIYLCWPFSNPILLMVHLTKFS